MAGGEGRHAVVLTELPKADGGGWLAEVPALPGCTGDGATPAEAVADAEAAVAEWMDEARRLGRDVPPTPQAH